LPPSGAHIGSLVPAGTAAQVPLAQVSQAPPQPLLQHTPSTQLPELHSLPPPQAMPLAFKPQLVPVQKLPVAQSLSIEQLLRHWVPAALQVKGAQAVVLPVGQLPLPSQLAGPVAVPPLQVASRQGVPAGHTRQAPAPLQVPSLPQVFMAVMGHIPLGSGVPAATLVQVPTDPVTVQLLQLPVQASLQQTPSTQLFDRHSGPELQLPPSGLRPHMLLWHWLGDTHWVLLSQLLKQLPVALLH
jgi:hypothetical protein